MVDMVAIPQRLEQAIGEAQNHDVLDRLLTQEMIHAIDLAFRQHLQHLGVQCLGRIQVMAEGLLDHDASPAPALLLRHQLAAPSWSTTMPKKRSATAR